MRQVGEGCPNTDALFAGAPRPGCPENCLGLTGNYLAQEFCPPALQLMALCLKPRLPGAPEPLV